MGWAPGGGPWQRLRRPSSRGPAMTPRSREKMLPPLPFLCSSSVCSHSHNHADSLKVWNRVLLLKWGDLSHFHAFHSPPPRYSGFASRHLINVMLLAFSEISHDIERARCAWLSQTWVLCFLGGKFPVNRSLFQGKCQTSRDSRTGDQESVCPL